MNAVPDINLVEENGIGSDSDVNSDESPEYYQAISGGEDSSDSDDLPNGYPNGVVTNGVSSLYLSDDEEDKRREREREEEAAVRREEERRRNAPLGAENASRVVEAMRGVTFGGAVPVWARIVPEDEWIRRIREAQETIVRD